MAELTKAAFANHAGDTFSIHFDDVVVPLILASVDDRGHLDTEEVENFSLIFHGPAELALEQAAFPLEHETMGTNHVFLVPIREQDNRRYYEAVFSVKRSGVGT